MHQREQQPSTVPLRFSIPLPEYGVGEFEDSQSAIARPYRRLLEDGVDPGKIAYVLIHSASSSQYTILGTLCETSGQRLLFFPGGRIRRLNSLFKRQPTAVAQALDGIVDHITLDTNRTSHVTEVMSNGKRKVVLKLPRRREVGQALYAWFGITLRSITVLDRVPSKLWFSAECPASDVDRRIALFHTANRASRICPLPVVQTTPETFIQMNFFVDFNPSQTRTIPNTFLPNGPPELQEAIELPLNMTTPLYKLPFHSGVGMILINPIVWIGEPAQDVVLGF